MLKTAVKRYEKIKLERAQGSSLGVLYVSKVLRQEAKHQAAWGPPDSSAPGKSFVQILSAISASDSLIVEEPSSSTSQFKACKENDSLERVLQRRAERRKHSKYLFVTFQKSRPGEPQHLPGNVAALSSVGAPAAVPVHARIETESPARALRVLRAGAQTVTDPDLCLGWPSVVAIYALHALGRMAVS